MKIVLLHDCFEDYTTELANSLHPLVDLTVIQPDTIFSRYKHLLKPSVQVCSFKKYRGRDPRNFFSMRSLVKTIEAIGPDVVHVQETNDPWYDLTLGGRMTFPLVTTVHDVFRHPGDQDLAIGANLTRQFAFRRSEQFILHATQQAEAFRECYPQFSDSTNIVPHGELGSLFLRSLEQDSLSISREENTLLFFGRIWSYKGLRYLLEAMQLVIQAIPNVKLIIAGRGENLEQYSPLLSDKEHFVVLNRYIPMKEVTELFLKSTAVILPYTEASQSGVASIGYGLGTPIIASNIGGLSELIHSEQDGLLVPPCDVGALAEAILKLLRDKNLQSCIHSAALERCKQDISWDNIALQTVEVYKKIIH